MNHGISSPASHRPLRMPAAGFGAILLATLVAVGCGSPAAKLPTAGPAAMPTADAPAANPGFPAPAPERMPPGPVAVPFELTERSGAAFDSTSLAGKVWLASVFFANCPGTCFRENQAVADLLRRIPDPDFVAVSVTCDPDNDTPEALSRYADRFDAPRDRWRFLTGEMTTIKKIANDTFLLPAEVGVHSERGVVFDRRGRLRGSYLLLQPDRVKLLENLIRDLLAEPADDAAVVPPPEAAPAATPPTGSQAP
jgi:cytochrome oxidase Cu insertion factor (SCO1/SenC/PrrC family)